MWRGQPLLDSISFFQGKRVSHQPPQIPCVFSSKTRLAFNAEHPHIPCFSQRKRTSQESCHICCVYLSCVYFPCMFSNNPHFAFRSNCEFTYDEANSYLILDIFCKGNVPGRRNSWGKIIAIAKFDSYPSQEKRQILTKEHCTGDIKH